MKKIILFILMFNFSARAEGDFREMLELRSKNIQVTITMEDRTTAKLLKDAWTVVGGQREFLMRLTGIVPGNNDKFDVVDDNIVISGEKVFVASTASLVSKIMLNPSLKPEDFKLILSGAGAPEKMNQFNELRVKLGLPGNAAD